MEQWPITKMPQIDHNANYTNKKKQTKTIVYKPTRCTKFL